MNTYINTNENKLIDTHISLVVDMYGCPNRCKHCWLGTLPNNKMPDGIDEHIVNLFKSRFRNVTFYGWLREPDFCNNYRQRWSKDNDLSSVKPQRFELASFWRIVRDESYINFLKEVGVTKVQLTFFGMKGMTDKYVGRVGAFEELLKASDLLSQNGILPRWQLFINQENKEEIVDLLLLAKSKNIQEIFVHAGSCDGNNRNLYDIRINKNCIPTEVIPYYWDYEHILSEKECCQLLKDDMSHFIPDADELVINVTSDLNLYFNYTGIGPKWLIGNIYKDSFEQIVERILSKDIQAIKVAKQVTVKQLVERFGDFQSYKVFSLDDYKMYLLNRALEEN